MIKNVFLITNTSCNQSCSYCYYNIGVEKKIKGYLDYKLLKRFLNRRVHRISITGGEPLINPYLFKYLKIAKEKSNNIALSTNGKLLNSKMLADLKKAGVCRIFISLDDIVGELQNNLRSHSKKSTLRAIQLLTKSGLEVSITTVITSRNVDRIFEMQSYCLKNNFRFWPQPIYIVKNKKSQPLSLKSLGNRKWEKIINSIPKDMSSTRGAKFLNNYYQIFIQKKRKNIQCPFKNRQLVVNTNGDIKLCFHSQPISNIKNNKLSRISQSKIFKNENCFAEQCFQYFL